jgi:hypothetical protein
MWRTSDGRVNTVAMPDSSFLFTAPALSSVETVLAAIDAEMVDRLVGDLQAEAIVASETVPVDTDIETRFRHEAPPQRLFTAIVSDEQELRQAMAALDWRWQLDLAMAIEDITDAR